MELWQWALVVLAGLSAIFVMGAVVWGVFDIIRDQRLNQSATALWILVIFAVPLFGIVAWLYAKPRLGSPDDGLNFKQTF